VTIKHCDFCGAIPADVDDNYMKDWGSIVGQELDIELIDPVGTAGIALTKEWLSCPVCSVLIVAGDWDRLIKLVVSIEAPNDAIYEALLRFTYSKCFNLPDLLPGAIRL